MSVVASGFYVQTAGFYTVRWTVLMRDFPAGSPATVTALLSVADYPTASRVLSPGDSQGRAVVVPAVWLTPANGFIQATVSVTGATVTPRPTIADATFEVHALIP